LEITGILRGSSEAWNYKFNLIGVSLTRPLAEVIPAGSLGVGKRLPDDVVEFRVHAGMKVRPKPKEKRHRLGCPRQGRQLSHRGSTGNKQLAAINAVPVPISALSGMLLFAASYGVDIFVYNLAAHRAEAHGRIPAPMIEIRAFVSTHRQGRCSLRVHLMQISPNAVMSLINQPFRPMVPSFRHNLRPAPTETYSCHNVEMCR
jgi:hypothetical protein